MKGLLLVAAVCGVLAGCGDPAVEAQAEAEIAAERKAYQDLARREEAAQRAYEALIIRKKEEPDATSSGRICRRPSFTQLEKP